MFQYTQADIQQQVAALPPAFALWFQWMFAIIVLASLHHVPAGPRRS